VVEGGSPLGAGGGERVRTEPARAPAGTRLEPSQCCAAGVGAALAGVIRQGLGLLPNSSEESCSSPHEETIRSEP